MKRFTDTAKWDDPWYRKLTPMAKLLRDYIVDKCDAAGVIELDLEDASFRIGAKVSQAHLEELSSRHQILPGGKILVRRFVTFQVGEPREECPAHKPVLRLIREYGLERSGKDYRHPNGETPSDDEPDAGTAKPAAPPPSNPRNKASSPDEVWSFCSKSGISREDSDWFWFKMEGSGWLNGGKPVKSWTATLMAWKKAGYLPSQKNGQPQRNTPSAQEMLRDAL